MPLIGPYHLLLEPRASIFYISTSIKQILKQGPEIHVNNKTTIIGLTRNDLDRVQTVSTYMFSAQKPVILLPSPIPSQKCKSHYGNALYPPLAQPLYAFVPHYSSVNAPQLPHSAGPLHPSNGACSSHINTQRSNVLWPKDYSPVHKRIDSGDLAIRASAFKPKKRKVIDIEKITLHGRPRSKTRNAIASAKFRERRKMREFSLESRCEKLQESVKALELQIQQLKRDLVSSNQEKQHWKDHAHSLRLHVQSYV